MTNKPLSDYKEQYDRLCNDCECLIDDQLHLRTDLIRAKKQWRELLQREDLDMSVLADALALRLNIAGYDVVKSHP